MTNLSEELEVAVSAVTLACNLTLKVFRNLVQGEVLEKDDRTPVTVADLSSQALISILLLEQSSTVLIGEEDADELRESTPTAAELRARLVQLVNETLAEGGLPAGKSEDELLAAIDRGGKSQCGQAGRFWTCDPIDGTKGFLRQASYAVCLALIEDGLPILTVIGCPRMLVDPSVQDGAKGMLFVAEKGQGAYMHPLSSPASRTTLRIPALSADTPLLESYDPHHSDHDLSARTTLQLGIEAPPFRIDSQAKYCELVRGGGLFFRVRLPRGQTFQEKIWDHAPGALLVLEAGGSITTLEGEPLSFGSGRTFASRGIFASRREDHERVLAAARKAFDAPR